ncbi:hypothetical protein Vadar_008412 [Vaccinium darrowii]|uniref:Uncharacterized protein n=1 Tax=Vaccinium darrowii TaxID=229202 RepID=A0ACB7WYZ5_9ERIC|nr:hypothetical protein Vadar_008412 [Vaccinium darrowii]
MENSSNTLSNCPNLEHLRLFCLDQIVNLNVSASSSLQLKHLDIFQCKSLESLEFCAPKLVTFKYFGNLIRLSIGSLPLLAELDIGASHFHQAKFVLAPFSSYLSQIETLKLHVRLP